MKVGNILIVSALVLGTLYIFGRKKPKVVATIEGGDDKNKPKLAGNPAGAGSPPPPPFTPAPIKVLPKTDVKDADKTTINDTQAKNEVFGVDRPMPVTQDNDSASNAVVSDVNGSATITSTSSSANVVKVGNTTTVLPDVTSGNVTVAVGTSQPVVVNAAPTGIASPDGSAPVYVPVNTPAGIVTPTPQATYTGSAPGISLGVDGMNDSPRPKSWA